MNDLAAPDPSRRHQALDVIEAMLKPALAEVLPGTLASHVANLDEQLRLEVDVLDQDQRADVLRELVMLVMVMSLDLAMSLNVAAQLNDPEAEPLGLTPAKVAKASVDKLRRLGSSAD